MTIETSGPLGVLGKDTHCASQPQSLIAEYFIDCTPKGPPLPDGGTIPANHVRMTVQTDIVQNTLRQSYRERLTELINEFGTGLAGNAHALNQAVRLGSPALPVPPGALRGRGPTLLSSEADGMGLPLRGPVRGGGR